MKTRRYSAFVILRLVCACVEWFQRPASVPDGGFHGSVPRHDQSTRVGLCTEQSIYLGASTLVHKSCVIFQKRITVS